MKNQYLLFSVIWVLSIFNVEFASAQIKYLFTSEDVHEIEFNIDSCVHKANILDYHRKFKPKLDRNYHWYSFRKIEVTQGGFDEDLLHGLYREYHRNNQLRVKGSFKYGLKVGKWKTWDSSGDLKSVVKFKKGWQHGKAKYYSGGILDKYVKFKKGVRQKEIPAKKKDEKKEKPEKSKSKDKKEKDKDKSNKGSSS